MKPTRPRIHLVLNRPDGHCSKVEIEGDPVTPAMLDAAEDLLHALSTGERLLPKDFYDTCARAFDTTREDAKKRLTRARAIPDRLDVEGSPRRAPR